jgi:hypothetical protein
VQIENPAFHIGEASVFLKVITVESERSTKFAANTTTYEQDRFGKSNCKIGFERSVFVLGEVRANNCRFGARRQRLTIN